MFRKYFTDDELPEEIESSNKYEIREEVESDTGNKTEEQTEIQNERERK